MIPKCIRNRMNRNVVMLIFLILAAIAVAFTNKANAAGLPGDKAQVIKLESTF